MVDMSLSNKTWLIIEVISVLFFGAFSLYFIIKGFDFWVMLPTISLFIWSAFILVKRYKDYKKNPKAKSK